MNNTSIRSPDRTACRATPCSGWKWKARFTRSRQGAGYRRIFGDLTMKRLGEGESGVAAGSRASPLPQVGNEAALADVEEALGLEDGAGVADAVACAK